MWIQYKDSLVNLSLVKKIWINENKIIFFFDLVREDSTEFEFDTPKEADKFLFVKIYPLLNKLGGIK